MIKYLSYDIFRISLFSIFISFTLFLYGISYAKQDTLDTITGTLGSLTCETQGVGDLLRTEFSQTCIPAPFFTFATMNLVSPVLYMNTFLRLKINDHELFDKEFPGGQCIRQNRASYTDPKLSFALCNNAKLAAVRAKAIALSALAIAKATLTGSDPWDEIKTSWKHDKSAYHIFFHDKKPGDQGVMFDLGFPVIPWRVIQENDRICVATLGFSGYIPVGCKYIKEPFPWSIYGSFIGVGTHEIDGSAAATDPLALVSCSSVGDGGCYQRAYNASKTAVVITAPLIECIKQMTAKLLISKEVCDFDNTKQIINSASRQSSSLFQFQVAMHKIVTALLTLYIMFFGFKLILGGQVPQRAEVINFILKMLFVTYFSIGINITPGSDSAYDRMDGMTQYAFPFLLDGINTLASWVINASPSGLCKFHGSDIQYSDKMAYVALWDALDCRLAHYLGLDMLSTLLVENAYRSHDLKNFDFFNFSAPPYIYLLIPAIISSNLTLVSLALAYPLLVISVSAFMVNATVMCMISIVILGILAPLFVPMLLFQYTRGYFEAWVKLLISFLLQPMVIVTFMITMFSVYDFGFYGKCKYTSKSISNSIENIVQGGINSHRNILIYFVDNDWTKYTTQEAKSCKNSLGYMLNNPLATMYNFDKESLDQIVTEKPGSSSTDKFLSKFQFLSGIALGPGMFFTSSKILFEKVKDLLLALITACFTLYLMYNFSSQLAEFAADMTEGVALKNVAINPQAIFKAGMAAIAAAGQLAQVGDKIAGGAAGRAGDLAASGRGGVGQDLAAGSGRGSGGDFVSSSGGAATGGRLSNALSSTAENIRESSTQSITSSGPSGADSTTDTSTTDTSNTSNINTNIRDNLVTEPVMGSSTARTVLEDTAKIVQQEGAKPGPVQEAVRSIEGDKLNNLSNQVSGEKLDSKDADLGNDIRGDKKVISEVSPAKDLKSSSADDDTNKVTAKGLNDMKLVEQNHALKIGEKGGVVEFSEDPNRYETNTDNSDKANPVNDTNKAMAKGLADMKFEEQESHALKIGEKGYVAQEKRNAEIRDRRAKFEKNRERLLRSGGGRAKSSKDKKTERNDGMIETRTDKRPDETS